MEQSNKNGMSSENWHNDEERLKSQAKKKLSEYKSHEKTLEERHTTTVMTGTMKTVIICKNKERVEEFENALKNR